MAAILERCDFYLSKGVVPAEARAQAGLDVLKRQATRTVIPRFAETFIREVWEMQTGCLIQNHSKLKHWQAMLVSALGLTSYYFVKSQVMTQHRNGKLVGSLPRNVKRRKRSCD